MRQFIGANWRRGATTWTAVASVVCGATIFAGDARSERRLVGQENAIRLGLTRAWFTQVRLDGSRNHVERAVLQGDRLTVLTNAGVVHELNALTGQTYWIAPVGNENYPSLGPAKNEKFVALLNGSTLYVLDRADGKPVMIRHVGGAPGAAPALAEKYVFVPLVSGRIEGYSLGNQKIFRPWYYQSFGRAMVTPLATSESIVWTTDAGYLYVGNSNELGMRYRLETGSDIVAPAAYHKPYLYVASVSGDLFAMHELSGAQRWKYSTGFPITRAPAAVGERVFVTSAEPALHCIDANNCNKQWEAPHVVQFAAASKDRVYGVDDLGAFVVLNASTGAVLGRAVSGRPINALVNDQTDWVYLISDEGMVECLHEVGANAPLYHNPKSVEPTKAKKGAPAEGTAAAPATTKPAETSGEKPAAGPNEAMPAETPKENGGKQPEKKNDFGVEENPFG